MFCVFHAQVENILVLKVELLLPLIYFLHGSLLEISVIITKVVCCSFWNEIGFSPNCCVAFAAGKVEKTWKIILDIGLSLLKTKDWPLHSWPFVDENCGSVGTKMSAVKFKKGKMTIDSISDLYILSSFHRVYESLYCCFTKLLTNQKWFLHLKNKHVNERED